MIENRPGRMGSGIGTGARKEAYRGRSRHRGRVSVHISYSALDDALRTWLNWSGRERGLRKVSPFGVRLGDGMVRVPSFRLREL